MMEITISHGTGEEYLVLDRSVSRLIDHIARSSDANLLLDWPVHTIEYSASGAVLSGEGGRKLRCSKLVITVPISGLKNGGILFKPPLPEWKASAISRIQMSSAVKVNQLHRISCQKVHCSIVVAVRRRKCLVTQCKRDDPQNK